MAFYSGVSRAPKCAVMTKGKFAIREIMRILAPWILLKILRGEIFNAKKAFDEIPIFRERGVTKANAIGDSLGVRGFALWRDARNMPQSSADNAYLVLAGVPMAEHEQLAQEVGYATKDELYLAVLHLGFADMSEDEQVAAAEELGYQTVAELEAAMENLNA